MKTTNRYCIGMSSRRINEIYYEASSLKGLRDMLRNDYPLYCITRRDEVCVFGRMPNTNTDGWYLLGYLFDRG